MANVTPDFVQELLVEQLSSDLQQGNYVSTAANARNILRIAQRSTLHPEVLALAQRTVRILEDKGYSERRFLQEMAMIGHQERPCPENAVPVAADGTCPAGYFPLFADLTEKNTRKCCGKFQKELADMDQEVQQIHDRLPNTQDKIEFRNRFMVTDPKAKQQRDEMLGIGITPHISGFIDRYKQAEVERLTAKMVEVDAGKANVADVLGAQMTPTLYQRLKGLFGSVQKFLVWYVNRDWTFWWVIIYVFRWVALFGCMWLRVVNAGGRILDVFKEFVQRRFGITASVDYIRSTMMPSILAALMSSALVSYASQGLIQTGGWIMSVLGITSLTGRLMSLFQLPGFTIDLVFVLRDVLSFASAFVQGSTAQVAAGNWNPYTIVTGGMHQATSVYCDTQLRTFFALASNFVGELTINMFTTICQIIAKLLTTLSGFTAFDAAAQQTATWICSNFGELLKGVMQYFGRGAAQPDESTLGYVNRMATSGAGLTSMQLVGGAVSGIGGGLPAP